MRHKMTLGHFSKDLIRPCLRGQRGSSEEALDVLLCPLRGAISIATLGGLLARCVVFIMSPLDHSPGAMWFSLSTPWYKHKN